jgi:hypothetical protein
MVSFPSFERSLGWLADLVAQHHYRDDEPLPMRRRWSFDGTAWAIEDDPENEVSRFAMSGDFTDTPSTFDDLTVDNLAITGQAAATIDGATRFRVGAHGVTIGADPPYDGQSGALWFPNVGSIPAPPDGFDTGVIAFGYADEFWTIDNTGTPAVGHFRKILNGAGYVDLDGSEGVQFWYDGSELCVITSVGAYVQHLVNASRTGYSFEATAVNQYLSFRVGLGGVVYFDSDEVRWRDRFAADMLKLEISGTTRIVGIPARDTNGTGANIRIRPQPVNAGRGGIDTPGSLDIDLGQCVGTGTQQSGAINLHDQLGTAVSIALFGQSAEAATSYLYVQGTAAGGGRARNVALGFNSAGGISFGVGSTNVDLTMDATNIKLRYSAVTLLQATANGQSIGGDVESTQNGSLRIGNTGVPSAAPTAGSTVWSDGGQLRARGSRNVISEIATGKRSTTLTPPGPTRCYDRQDNTSIAGAGTTDLTLITSTEMPSSGSKWTMRCEVEWSAYDTDGDEAAGGRRRATVFAAGGTPSVKTSVAAQVDGTDDNGAPAYITSGSAGVYLHISAGDLRIRFTTAGGNVLTYFNARIIATIWENA